MSADNKVTIIYHTYLTHYYFVVFDYLPPNISIIHRLFYFDYLIDCIIHQLIDVGPTCRS